MKARKRLADTTVLISTNGHVAIAGIYHFSLSLSIPYFFLPQQTVCMVMILQDPSFRRVLAAGNPDSIGFRG
jgi:hypothetical protein